MGTFTFAKLYKAYIDCRKHKRGTINALKFEYNLERNLLDLYYELLEDRYEVGRSVCFMIIFPKPREIWAVNFRDRIVHHLIYNEIREMFYNCFIKDTYSCIPERGTTNAVASVERHVRSATDNYKKVMYFLKADIKNFFVSIDKNILYREVEKKVSEAWVLKLIQKVIFHDPKENVCVKSPKYKFDYIPAYKSLWHTPEEKGLPIGNLTSQFFSNVYLNVLDQYVKHGLKCKYYSRYVDDFVIIHEDPAFLNYAHKEITRFLRERLALELHQNKKLINRVDKGIDFVGYVVKPYHMQLRQKTLKRAFKLIREFKSKENWFYKEELEHFVLSITSYLGMLRFANGYRLRREICLECINLFISCDEEFTKLKLNIK